MVSTLGETDGRKKLLGDKTVVLRTFQGSFEVFIFGNLARKGLSESPFLSRVLWDGYAYTYPSTSINITPVFICRYN